MPFVFIWLFLFNPLWLHCFCFCFYYILRSCEIHRLVTKNVNDICQHPNWSVNVLNIIQSQFSNRIIQWFKNRVVSLFFCYLLHKIHSSWMFGILDVDCPLQAWTLTHSLKVKYAAWGCTTSAACLKLSQFYTRWKILSPVHVCPASLQCTSSIVWTIRFFPKWISIFLCAVSLCV